MTGRENPDVRKTLVLRAREDARQLYDEISVPAGVKKPVRVALYVCAAFSAVLLWKPLSGLLFQVVFAVLLSMACAPLAALYEKKMSRGLSCLLSLISLFLAAALCVALLIPPLVSQFQLLLEQLPRLMKTVQQLLRHWQNDQLFAAVRPDLSPDALSPLLSNAAAWLTEQAPRLFSSLLRAAESISRAFISPVLSYYFLRDRETFCYRLSLWIPLRHRKKVLIALQEVRREAGSYIRGQLLVALCVGALTALGLMLTGVPGYLVLGLVMGICEIIPYVGPLLGSIPIVLFTLPQGWTTVLWALGVTIAVQQLENIVIAPRLMGGATGLHPAYVILLLTAGGMLMGLTGMLVALPVFVSLRGLFRMLR